MKVVIYHGGWNMLEAFKINQWKKIGIEVNITATNHNGFTISIHLVVAH